MEKHDNIIKTTHSHPLSFLRFYISGIFVLLLGFWSAEIFVPLGLIILIFSEIIRRSETFYIMDSGVGREYKFLTTSRKFIGYDKIQNIEVEQSIIDNIFGVGTVKFDTAGMDGVELHFGGVEKPHKIEELVREKMIAS